MATPVNVGLFVRLEALPGKEDDVAAFLDQGLELVEQEPDTDRWFAVRFGPSSFGIFDAFPDDSGRQAHLNGAVGQALAEKAGELFEPPNVEQLDVLAEKPPQ
ncbi:MAG: antibiotic biosynthesis monooxygenase [Actinobacteria bacterium]|nr:MAG: antibiotic biosynthesis monooxygenase [Actinomycetota bacterium]